MTAREQHTDEQISGAADWLRKLPVVEKKRTASSRMEVVRRLRAEIHAALQRGYDHAQIAEGLSTHGVKISANTLKNYLQRAKGASKKTGRKTGSEATRKPDSPDASTSTENITAATPTATAHHAASARSKGGEDAKQSAPTTKPNEKIAEARTGIKREYDADSASFTPKPDRGKL